MGAPEGHHDTDPGSTAHVSERRVVAVPSDEAELRTIRRSIGDFVSENGGDDELKADLVLAACELSTNVMQHTDAETVTVAVHSNGSTWQLDVSDADHVPSLDAVDVPPATSTSGRGLMIVSRLMDDVRVVEIDGRTVIRCTRRVA